MSFSLPVDLHKSHNIHEPHDTYGSHNIHKLHDTHDKSHKNHELDKNYKITPDKYDDTEIHDETRDRYDEIYDEFHDKTREIYDVARTYDETREIYDETRDTYEARDTYDKVNKTRHELHQNGEQEYHAENSEIKYLMSYGYLPKLNLETGELRSNREFQQALRNFQKFAHIPETGQLDAQTLEAMGKPRCGKMDLKYNKNDPSNYKLGPSKWEKKWLTFRILNYSPKLTRRETHDSIIRAFHVWGDEIPLTFHESGPDQSADIYIQFSSRNHGDGYPFDGPGMVLAHAFFPGDGKGGDVHFDGDESWSFRSEKGFDLFMVAAHELGHSLGLAHSNVPGSLMYPWHQGYKHDFKLHPDDIAAIQHIYGRKLHSPPFHPTTTSMVTYSDSVVTSKQFRYGLSSADMTVSDACSSINAISVIRGETFIFSGKLFWRITNGVMNHNEYPAKIKDFWIGFPDNLDRIDAVFENPHNGKIIFFIGDKYWEFKDNRLAPYFPQTGRPISDYGLPKYIKHIDAAFDWGKNKRIYLITSNIYWRLNNISNSIEAGYPRKMHVWNGVPIPIDSAFTNVDGRTYFFKKSYYWEFNNLDMYAFRPKLIGEKWLKCDMHIPFKYEEQSSLPSSAFQHLYKVIVYFGLFALHVIVNPLHL